MRPVTTELLRFLASLDEAGFARLANTFEQHHGPFERGHICGRGQLRPGQVARALTPYDESWLIFREMIDGHAYYPRPPRAAAEGERCALCLRERLKHGRHPANLAATQAMQLVANEFTGRLMRMNAGGWSKRAAITALTVWIGLSELERQVILGSRREDRTVAQWERMYPAHAAGDDFTRVAAPFIEVFGSLHPVVPANAPPFQVTFA